MDWMFDETFNGKRLWVLTAIDTWSRVCPVIRACRSATAMAIIVALDEARRAHGFRWAIRLDQGSQFRSKELDLWAYTNGVTFDFSRPAKATDTDVIGRPLSAIGDIFIAYGVLPGFGRVRHRDMNRA